MTVPNPALRHQVMHIYKGIAKSLPFHLLGLTYGELLFLGREYPKGYDYYRTRLRKAFASQRDLADENQIKKAIQRAEFVKKEIEALYYLKRYRTLRQRYEATT